MNIFQTINLILLLLYFNSCFGQDFKFDKLVKNKFSTEFYPNQEWTNLFNSKDYSYHMQIYSQNDSLKSRIFDTKKSQVHNFYIDDADFLKLKFLHTLNMTKTTNEYTFEFSQIEKRKDENEVTFKIFDKRKKRIAKYELTTKETDQNFFSIFKLSALETLLFTEIVSPMNFIVLRAKGKNINGKTVEYELSSIEDVIFSVSIPQKY